MDNARKLIGKTIDIVVSSVLQTTAGKMIFGRHIEPGTAAQPQTSQGPGQPAGNPGADRDDTSRKSGPVPQL